MMTAIAEDWHEELKRYPGWAIQNACRWWMSVSNGKRRQKPLPGDIAERARKEIGIVRAAEYAVRRFERGSSFTGETVPRHKEADATRDEGSQSIEQLVSRFVDRRAAE